MKIAAVLFSIIMIIPAALWSSSHPLDVLLPNDNELPDWKRDTVEDICGEWESSDFVSFYEEKDGGAEFYQECGFISGIYRGFIDTDTKAVCIDLYNFSIPENAKKVYKHPALDDGNFEYISSLGDSARFQDLFADYILEVISGQYYMKLTTKAIEKYKQPLIDMAGLIVKQTPISNKNGDPVKKIKGLHISSGNRYKNILFTVPCYDSPGNILRDTPYLMIYDMCGRVLKKVNLTTNHKNQLQGLWSGKSNHGAVSACGQYLALFKYQDITLSKRFVFDR